MNQLITSEIFIFVGRSYWNLHLSRRKKLSVVTNFSELILLVEKLKMIRIILQCAFDELSSCHHRCHLINLHSDLNLLFTYFRTLDCKLSHKSNKNEVSVSCKRNLSSSETEGGGGGGDIIFYDMVSVTANAGSFEAPNSFDDGYDSSNSFPHSPGKYLIPVFRRSKKQSS